MTTRHKRLFSLLSCNRIEYTLASSLDKFRLDEFLKEMADRIRGPLKGARRFWFVAPTRNPKSTGYHVHFACRVERPKFRASLEYVNGSETPDAHETRPFAEELMGWIGQFFRSEQVTADVEGTFGYPLKRFQPVLPIPMRLTLDRRQEVEVIAMSVLMAAKSQGVYSALVGLDDDEVGVDVYAERIVKLKDFDMRRDLFPLSSVARSFVREVIK